MKKNKWDLGVSLIHNVVAIIFVVIEMFISTILGNVILLGMALILSFSGALLVVVSTFKKPNKLNVLSLLFSLVIIIYVLIMIATNSIPAGYRP